MPLGPGVKVLRQGAIKKKGGGALGLQETPEGTETLPIAVVLGTFSETFPSGVRDLWLRMCPSPLVATH